MTSPRQADVSARFAAPDRYDLRATVMPLRLGRGDRTAAVGPGELWRATRTPDGPATGRYRSAASTGSASVVVDAWGQGAAWLVEHAPDLLGLTDAIDGFDDLAAAHPVVAKVAHERPGVRIPRSHAVYEGLLPAVLCQKVTGIEAKRAWRGLVERWGEPAPGPAPGLGPPLLLPPSPEALEAVPYHALHPLGVERKRADLLRLVARSASRLDEAAAMSPSDARRRITALPGIGDWSYAEVGRTALGDPDAVSVGDYHLKNTVTFALTGVHRGTDERMLELLEPFAPHRGRVCRLLELAGLFAPRKGPRLVPTPWLRPRSA